MFGCNTVCPKCRHEFRCCVPASGTGACPLTAANRRSLHGLSGGGLVQDQQEHHILNTTNNNNKSTTLSATSLFSPANQSRSAQISPSAPVSFVLPFPPTPSVDATESRPETEFQRLKESVRLLHESGWYHEGLTWQQSQAALKGTEPGTFLIRDSSDPKFLYALSVQTEQGPTSVRLHYVSGKFRLDSESYLAPLMPLFNSVLDLCAYYVRCSARNASSKVTGNVGGGGGGSNLMPPPPTTTSTNGGQVWVDANGCLFSRILFKRPLLRADRVPSLQHLARLAVHGALEASTRPRLALLPPPHTQLELPTRLVEYLAEYPYSL